MAFKSIHKEQDFVINGISKELKISYSEVLFLMIELGQAFLLTNSKDDVKEILKNYLELKEYKNIEKIQEVIIKNFECGKIEN